MYALAALRFSAGPQCRRRRLTCVQLSPVSVKGRIFCANNAPIWVSVFRGMLGSLIKVRSSVSGV